MFLFLIHILEEERRASGLMFSLPWGIQTLLSCHINTCVYACVCVSDGKRESGGGAAREGEARINTKPSGGLLLPEREGTGHPAESGEGESNSERER